MKISLKYKIIAVIILLAAPITYLLYEIWNLTNYNDGTFLFKYMIFTALSWIALSPILLNLLNIYAKQLAEIEFKQWKNDRKSK